MEAGVALVSEVQPQGAFGAWPACVCVVLVARASTEQLLAEASRLMYEGTPARLGNWCVRCYRPDTQPAGEECKNPAWHIPAQEASDEERRKDEVRLPYAED